MTLALIQRIPHGVQKCHTIPISYCIGLALGQAAMQTLSNMAMHYLNYPAKVLFKSCRVLPTMIMGVAVFKKSYVKREWIAMLMLVGGLVVFMQADMKSSPNLDPMGVLLISLSLCLDAGLLNVQEYLFSAFGCEEDEIVLVSYAGGSALLLVLCLVSGEMTSAVNFMNSSMSGSIGFAVASLAALSVCGFCGVVCVTTLTRRFGALVAALTTTARKAVTLVISFTLFPNPVANGHIFGASLFIFGIFLKATTPKRIRKDSTNSLATRFTSADDDEEGGDEETSHLQKHFPRTSSASF